MSGLCEYKLRRYDAALESLTHAESLKFEEPPELARAARLHLALVLTKTGSFERAITVLTEMILVHKKAPDAIAVARDRRAAPALAAFRSARGQPRTGLPTRRRHGVGDGEGLQGSDAEVRSAGPAVSAGGERALPLRRVPEYSGFRARHRGNQEGGGTCTRITSRRWSA